MKKLFDGVILFKEYFDVLGEYLCGEFFGRTNDFRNFLSLTIVDISAKKYKFTKL